MSGVLIFYDEQHNVLLKTICKNVERSKEKYLTSANFKELQEKISQTETKEFDSLLEALIYFKSLQEGEHKQHKNYQYLALDSDETPCLSSLNTTATSGKIFVGPFRNPFILSDIADAFAREFALPTLGEEKSCPKILDYYLNFELRKNYLQQISNLEESLEFAKSHELSEKAKPILKYFDYLWFLQESKSLSFKCQWEGSELLVGNGLLYGYGDLRFRMNYQEIEYREEEKFAVPLDELDEREIIYQFAKELKKI